MKPTLCAIRAISLNTGASYDAAKRRQTCVLCVQLLKTTILLSIPYISLTGVYLDRPSWETTDSYPIPERDQQESNSGLISITGGSKRASFKSKGNMTLVRKTAMAAFLKENSTSSKKPKYLEKLSRLSSVDSESEHSWRSNSSVGDWDTTTELSTISTEDPRRSRTSFSATSFTGTYSDEQDPSDAPTARAQGVHDFVIPAAPMFLPCQTGVPHPYDAFTPPPFVSIGKSIDPFRTFCHPPVSLEELKFHAVRYFGTRALGRYWIPTALAYTHTFLGTLCITAAYHDTIYERSLDSMQTLALHQEVYHLVSSNMLDLDARVADHNIMAVIQLIISDAIRRDNKSVLNMHEDGIEMMIKQRGGLQKLGVNGRLAATVSWVSLAIAVMDEISPRVPYTEYCVANSTRQYRSTATIPESPIYNPRSKWETIARSKRCTPEAQGLLEDIRTMIDFWLEESNDGPPQQSPQTMLTLYEKITSLSEYPSIHKIRKARILTQHDYKYEAIRIATIIQAEAIMQKVPLSDALPYAMETQVAPESYNTSTTSVPTYDRSPDIVAYEGVTLSSFQTPARSPAISYSHSVNKSVLPSKPSLDVPGPSGSSDFSVERSSVSSVKPPLPIYVDSKSASAPAPSNPDTLLKHLRATIESSNISACWSDMAGVLLWISLVVGAASRKSESKILKKYFCALAMRVSIMLCFEHPEAINSTMLRMCEVIKALDVKKQGSLSSNEGTDKKARTGEVQ
jgi:hypothetical protein